MEVDFRCFQCQVDFCEKCVLEEEKEMPIKHAHSVAHGCILVLQNSRKNPEEKHKNRCFYAHSTEAGCGNPSEKLYTCYKCRFDICENCLDRPIMDTVVRSAKHIHPLALNHQSEECCTDCGESDELYLYDDVAFIRSMYECLTCKEQYCVKCLGYFKPMEDDE